MIWFCHFCKNKICFGCCQWGPQFCASWVKKLQILEVLAIFFRTTGFQLKLLIFIESTHFTGKQRKKSEWVWSWGKI